VFRSVLLPPLPTNPLPNTTRHTPYSPPPPPPPQTKERFPTKGTAASRSTRVPSTRKHRSTLVLAKGSFPCCLRAAPQSSHAVRRLRRGEAAPRKTVDYDDLLLLLGADGRRARDRGRHPRVRLRSRDGRRSIRHERAAGHMPAVAEALRARHERVRGRRRASILSRSRAATVRTASTFQAVHAASTHRHAWSATTRSTQPILACLECVIAFAAERTSKTLWSERAPTARPSIVAVRDEANQPR